MRRALVLAFVWGAVWAGFLQYTEFGRHLADKRTWVTVVAGVGVDLAIGRLVLDKDEWEKQAGIIAVSSLPIILRSLVNEQGS